MGRYFGSSMDLASFKNGSERTTLRMRILLMPLVRSLFSTLPSRIILASFSAASWRNVRLFNISFWHRLQARDGVKTTRIVTTARDQRHIETALPENVRKLVYCNQAVAIRQSQASV